MITSIGSSAVEKTVVDAMESSDSDSVLSKLPQT